MWLVIIPRSKDWFMERPHTMPVHTHMGSWLYWSRSEPFQPIDTGNSSALTTGRCTPPPLGHYKKRRTPSSSTIPPSALLPHSLHLSIALTERHHHHFFTAVAKSPRHSSVLGEVQNRTPASSSSFPCSHGKPPWPGAAIG
jgi:hypothetical protein